MSTTPTARMSALYHALFDIYDCLIVLATDLIQQHETAASSTARLADLTDLLAALSLPAEAHRRPQVAFANLVSSFALCARAVERAAETYGELKTELAGASGVLLLVEAWEKIDAIAQTVARLCGVLKTMIGE